MKILPNVQIVRKIMAKQAHCSFRFEAGRSKQGSLRKLGSDDSNINTLFHAIFPLLFLPFLHFPYYSSIVPGLQRTSDHCKLPKCYFEAVLVPLEPKSPAVSTREFLNHPPSSQTKHNQLRQNSKRYTYQYNHVSSTPCESICLVNCPDFVESHESYIGRSRSDHPSFSKYSRLSICLDGQR